MQFAVLRFTLITVLLNLALLSSACAQQPDSDAPRALMAYPKSDDVRYQEKDGMWWLYYDVQEEYPAKNVLRFIQDSLKRQGWQPQKDDILNPGIPSSHVRGWQKYLDGRASPTMQVHQWLAQWKDSKGNVVVYRLKYEHPTTTTLMPKTVSVVGIYTPASIVEEQLKWIESDSKKKDQ